MTKKACALQRRVDELAPWFYSFDLGHGVSTTSKLGPIDENIHATRRDMLRDVVRRHFGDRVSEISAIDIGCHEGFFSIALAELGVGRILGVDIREDSLRKADFVSRTLGLTNIRFRRDDCEHIDPSEYGRFDLCLFMGLLYHLENPVRALRIAAEVTSDFLVLDTQLVDDIEGTAEWGSERHRLPYRGVFAVIDEGPAHSEDNKETGLTPLVLCPSLKALQNILHEVGFRRVEIVPPLPDAHEQYRRGKRVIVAASDKHDSGAIGVSTEADIEERSAQQFSGRNADETQPQLERFHPRLEWPELAYEHWHRYLFAAELAGGKVVLDIASGEGYGSDLLAMHAKEVVGVDVDPDAIRSAAERYQRPNLRFLEGHASAVPIDGHDVFDLVVSFETIEHLYESEQEAFLGEMKRLLTADGMLIISTPNRGISPADTDNIFHRHEMSSHEFIGLLSTHFEQVAAFGQRVYPASYAWPLRSSGDGRAAEYRLEFADGAFEPCPGRELEPEYVIAVCSNVTIDLPGSSILVDLDRMAIEQPADQLRRRDAELRGCSERARHLAHRIHGRATEMPAGAELAAARREFGRVTEYARHLEHELESAGAEYRRLEGAYEKLRAHAEKLEAELGAKVLGFDNLAAFYLEAKDYIKHLERQLHVSRPEGKEDSDN